MLEYSDGGDGEGGVNVVALGGAEAGVAKVALGCSDAGLFGHQAAIDFAHFVAFFAAVPTHCLEPGSEAAEDVVGALGEVAGQYIIGGIHVDKEAGKLGHDEGLQGYAPLFVILDVEVGFGLDADFSGVGAPTPYLEPAEAGVGDFAFAQACAHAQQINLVGLGIDGFEQIGVGADFLHEVAGGHSEFLFFHGEQWDGEEMGEVGSFRSL